MKYHNERDAHERTALILITCYYYHGSCHTGSIVNSYAYIANINHTFLRSYL